MTVHFNRAPGVGALPGLANGGSGRPQFASMPQDDIGAHLNGSARQDADSDSSSNPPTKVASLPHMIPGFGKGDTADVKPQDPNAQSADNSSSSDSSDSSDASNSNQVKTADEIKAEGNTQQAKDDLKTALAQNPNDQDLIALNQQLNPTGSQLNAVG